MSDILHFSLPHPGPLHFRRNGEGDSIFFSICIFSAFSWLESGEGGQRPDEVKCGADSLLVREIFWHIANRCHPRFRRKELLSFRLPRPWREAERKTVQFSIKIFVLLPWGKRQTKRRFFLSNFPLARPSIRLNSLNFWMVQKMLNINVSQQHTSYISLTTYN